MPRIPVNMDFRDIEVPVCVDGAKRSLTIRARIRGKFELVIESALEEETWEENQEEAAYSVRITMEKEDGGTASLKEARAHGFAVVQDLLRKKREKKSKEPGKASLLRKE